MLAMRSKLATGPLELSTIPPAELTRDADALIPELIPEAVAALTSLAQRTAR
jgi:hypothetical protein